MALPKLLYNQHNCGLGGSASLIIGESPTVFPTAGTKLVVATANTTGAEDIIFDDVSTSTVDDTTYKTNIMRNLMTGEIVIGYVKTALTETITCKRGVSFMQSAYNLGLTTYVKDIAVDDEFEIVAEWHQVCDPYFHIFEVRDGVTVRMANETFDMMSDQSGLLCRLFQGYTGEVETRFPKNVYEAYQKYLYSNVPHSIEQTYNTNVNNALYYQAIAGIVAKPVCVIVVPELWRTDAASVDTNGDFIYLHSFVFPNCYPDAKQEYAFKKDGQVDFPIIYKAGKDSYLETVGTFGWFGAANS